MEVRRSERPGEKGTPVFRPLRRSPVGAESERSSVLGGSKRSTMTNAARFIGEVVDEVRQASDTWSRMDSAPRDLTPVMMARPGEMAELMVFLENPDRGPGWFQFQRNPSSGWHIPKDQEHIYEWVPVPFRDF